VELQTSLGGWIAGAFALGLYQAKHQMADDDYYHKNNIYARQLSLSHSFKNRIELT